MPQARFVEIPCKWVMLPSSLSKNTFRLLPNCENSSRPSALIRTDICPCVILSNACRNSMTVRSMPVPISTVMPTSIIDANTITIILTRCTVAFTCTISAEVLSLTVVHNALSSLFNTTFSAFKARILSSSAFICWRNSFFAFSLAIESCARSPLDVYSGIFSASSAASASIFA